MFCGYPIYEYAWGYQSLIESATEYFKSLFRWGTEHSSKLQLIVLPRLSRYVTIPPI